jgi:hypothetical protein
MAFSIADITGLLGVGGKKRPSASTSAAADSGQVRSGRLSVDGPPLYRAGRLFSFRYLLSAEPLVCPLSGDQERAQTA